MRAKIATDLKNSKGLLFSRLIYGYWKLKGWDGGGSSITSSQGYYYRGLFVIEVIQLTLAMPGL